LARCSSDCRSRLSTHLLKLVPNRTISPSIPTPQAEQAFWLGLVEFWEAARQRYLRRVLAGEARASICYPSSDDPGDSFSPVQGLARCSNSPTPARRHDSAPRDSAIQHGPFPESVVPDDFESTASRSRKSVGGVLFPTSFHTFASVPGPSLTRLLATHF
jgi:hypothetical protein